MLPPAPRRHAVIAATDRRATAEVRMPFIPPGSARLGTRSTGAGVVAPGGLRLRDTETGVTALPGCCNGLENWRDWLDLLDGEEPWLGHDPTPGVEHLGATVRLWPDGDDREGIPILLPLAQLPALLRSVQEQLVGFLSSVEEWTTRYAPPLATAVAAKLSEDLAIGGPLHLQGEEG
ncbi:hypothetical protein [Streptomyces sp. NPDC055189]